MLDWNNIQKVIMDDVFKDDYKTAIRKLDLMTEKEPDNVEILKAKAEVLFFDNQYEEALLLCDEYLRYNPTDVQVLQNKADTLIQLSRYPEAVEVCQQALSVAPNNKDIRHTLDTAQVLGGVSNRTCAKKTSMWWILIAILILGLVIYFHPTRETMQCNSQFQCQVEHEFINLFTLNKSFNVDKNTDIDYKVTYIAGHRGSRGRYKTKIYFNGKSPFIMCINTNTSESVAISMGIREIQDFNQYKSGIVSRYYVRSDANPFGTYLFLGVYLIILFIYIKTIMEDNTNG